MRLRIINYQEVLRHLIPYRYIAIVITRLFSKFVCIIHSPDLSLNDTNKQKLFL